MRQCGSEQTREENANPSAVLACSGGRSCISLETEDAGRALAGRGVPSCGFGDAKAGEGKPEGRLGSVAARGDGCVALLVPRGSRVLVSVAWHAGIPLGTETLLQSCSDCQRAVCVMASLTQQMKSGSVPGHAADCSSSNQVLPIRTQPLQRALRSLLQAAGASRAYLSPASIARRSSTSASLSTWTLSSVCASGVGAV